MQQVLRGISEGRDGLKRQKAYIFFSLPPKKPGAESLISGSLSLSFSSFSHPPSWFAMKSSVFSSTVIRELTDKTYDRRKVAALEVESLVKQNKESREQIIGIIQELVNDFVYSADSNAQCGGLISLAATAIALGPSVAAYLDTVVPPILTCLSSKESRVRYYACECMYNVAKVSKGELLRFFNELFEAQCTLASDKEQSVRNGREILDRLVKEIVYELAATHVSPYTEEGKAFSLAKFIPVLRRHVYSCNPFERMYVMSWIGILDSVPGLDLMWYLPDFLDGLMRYLTDTRHQIRSNARILLNQLFQQVQYISRQNEDEGVAIRKEDETVQTTKHLQYDRMLDILIQHVSSTKEDIQRTALQWMIELIAVAKTVVIAFTPRIVGAVLPLLQHSIPTISAFAIETNRNLQKLVLDLTIEPVASHSDPPTTHSTMPMLLRRQHRSDIGRHQSRRRGEPFDYSMIVANLRLQLVNEHEQTRLASLEWLLLLHKKAPNKILASADGTFPLLLKTLSDSSEEVVRSDLELLAQVSATLDDDAFHSFIKNLLSLFETDRRLLETRGSLIIRQLCIHLDPEKIYHTMAIILEKDQDLEFASMMVQNLNIIMITSSEMDLLRKDLRKLDVKEGQELFLTLYRSWSHNAVAAFSLALIAQAYELAANMLQIFADLEVTVTMLIQLDQLVQLLESPAFTYLRLQLLEPDKYPHLFKCLYGIFMLLPQSSAFSTLRSRLNSASSLGFLHVMPKSNIPSSRIKSSATHHSKHSEPSINFGELLSHFKTMQQIHQSRRQ
ncbi:vacuolar protein 14 C-terminal Fig4p binding-domain-containing protein [Fennellomyces sp. T-0311]|nr:vacuolar protein 14 C-terminal Fig4p binding-domain-containing protein [Fennellomyces sp. T-0311]